MTSQGHPTTRQERLDILTQAQAGQTDPQIAAQLGRSIWTVRKWRRKASRLGSEGLFSRMGRPSTGPLGAFPPQRADALRTLRQAHPGWGPITLRLELENDPRLAQGKLPSRARIAVFLKQEHLVRPYSRKIPLPQPPPRPPQVHQEWELDAQGSVEVSGLGKVSILNIGDVKSRLKVESYPWVGSSPPRIPDYQLSLRRAFRRYGLPQTLSLDHDPRFYDATCASPYPTGFHLWLIALGIEVRFIRRGQPTDHGIIERTHQTIFQQALEGQTYTPSGSLHRTLDHRREFLNTRYPSRALGGTPPLTAYPQALHSGRGYHPSLEKDLLDLTRVYDYLAQGRWFRKTCTKGQVFLGNHRYGLGKTFASQTVEITFDPLSLQMVFRSEEGLHTLSLPAQGVSKEDLLGELTPLTSNSSFQLDLPLTFATWRQATLCQEMTGTTF